MNIDGLAGLVLLALIFVIAARSLAGSKRQRPERCCKKCGHKLKETVR
jgi:hypothetical protein